MVGNRKPAKGTPWTTKKVDNLFANLRKLSTCMERVAESLGGSTPDALKSTTSTLFTGSIDDTESFGGPTAAESRSVEVQTNGDGVFEVNIVKLDGSNLTFRTFGNSAWGYEGLLTEAPITQVTVTNVTGSAGAVDAIINVVSRS